ncbi:MAG: metal-dependent hydrolase [Bacteroidetes bacterium]|nr:metal-dependent hydrolase [Bacteroidota bacterium]
MIIDMPNLGQHIKAGVVCGGLAAGVENVYEQLKSSDGEKRFDFAELGAAIGIGSAVGILGGMAPDVIEPATHPNHRGLAHSILVLLVIILILRFLYKQFKDNPIAKAGIIGFGAGYASHIAMDSITPKGVPIV